jgi:hypothetical protein
MIAPNNIAMPSRCLFARCLFGRADRVVVDRRRVSGGALGWGGRLRPGATPKSELADGRIGAAQVMWKSIEPYPALAASNGEVQKKII